MRALFTAFALIALGLGLSGCAVAAVGGAVVGAGVSAVSTAADVTGSVVSAPFDAIGGGDDSDED